MQLGVLIVRQRLVPATNLTERICAEKVGVGASDPVLKNESFPGGRVGEVIGDCSIRKMVAVAANDPLCMFVNHGELVCQFVRGKLIISVEELNPGTLCQA